MPTTVTKTIKSGGDYTTLQAWEDAAPANYVTADQVWQGQASGSFVSATNLLTVSGGTVDATCYLELTTEAGASFRDNVNVQTNALRFNSSNGCAITCTGSYATPILINQEFCRFSNLQIANTGVSGGTGTLVSQLVSGSSSLDVNNCILEGSRGGVLQIFGSGQKARNSLIVMRKASATEIAFVKNGAGAINTTFAVPSNLAAATVAVIGAYVASSYKNCNFFGCTSVSSGTAPSFTTCYTSVASPPSGCTTAAYSTAQFVNVTDTTHDYRLPSGSAMIDVGTTDATNAPIDIAGTARPSGSAYDVGCWEYVAAITSRNRRTLGLRIGSRQVG